MKLVINNCFGGFEIAEDFYKHYDIPYVGSNVTGLPYMPYDKDYWRKDSRLIEYIENFGSEKASGLCSELIVVDIPEGTRYRITDYDGRENIEIEDDDWDIAD